MNSGHHALSDIRRVACFVIALICASPIAFAQSPSPSNDSRTIHFFDFDERDDGNLERIPKFWVTFESDDFPSYTTGTFDTDTGHDAAPSFKLVSQGRNVAYRYAGPDTTIRPNSDYIITGWIQGQNLEHARASISAYYLDDRRLPIPGTQQFSRLIGGDPNDNSWHRVEVYLPAGPPDARTIGLTAWIVQPDVWNQGPKPTRHISRYDVNAEARFDDVAVIRLPRVSIDTHAVGNIYTPKNEHKIHGRVIDNDPDQLSARMEIRDVDGFTINSVAIPVSKEVDSPTTSLDIASLPYGGYEAVLIVETNQRRLAERRKRFAIVSGSAMREGVQSRTLGVSLSVDDRADPEVRLAMLQLIGAGVLKMPVWSGQGHIPDLMNTGSETDVLLQGLVRSRVNIIGVLAGAPSELIQTAGAYPRSLMTLLSEEPDKWKDHLIRVYAPYSSIFRSWQIGQDGDASIMGDRRLPNVIANVRQAVNQLNTQAHLTIPISLNSLPDVDALEVDEFSITIDDAVHHNFIQEHLDSQRNAGVPVRDAFLPMPATNRGWMKDGLPGWCKRIIQTRFAGVETVIVPQPWTTRIGYGEEITEPNEAFVVLYTFVRRIGDAVPGQRIAIAPGITALSFYGPRSATLVAWNDHATRQSETHTIQLGANADTLTDMWGRRVALQKNEDDRQILKLTREPVYIENVDPFLLRVRSGVSINPPTLDYNTDIHEHTLVISNPGTTSMAGSVNIEGPLRWSFSPSRFDFAVPPGSTYEHKIDIRFNRDESAGPKIIKVHMDVIAKKAYKLVVPVTMQLLNEDLEAWGYAVVEGDRLVVRHSVTNRSGDIIHLRSSAIAPNKARQNRILLSFNPNQTTTVEYHFKEWKDLKGRRIRLYLKEINGTRIHNVDIQVPD